MKKEDFIAMLLFKFLHNVADIHNLSGEALNPHDEVYAGQVEECAKLIAGLETKGEK